MDSLKSLLQLAITASLKAGEEILNIYRQTFLIEYKEDNSPITDADRKANDVILDYLKSTHIPVLSEESEIIAYEKRKNLEYLWVVDPLDGTKEFVKRNGEFTVNIALLYKGEPIIGVVYAPVCNVLYYSLKGFGAYKLDNESVFQPIESGKRLPIFIRSEKTIRIVASRSHRNQQTEDFLNLMKKKNHVEVESVGSSLKLCLVAEGTADVYPRFGPTNEWDIAAGAAIVMASGGMIIETVGRNSLQFNKENLKNPDFIVLRNSDLLS